MIDPSRVPPAWRALLQPLDIDNLFENSALRQRALELYRERRCSVITVGPKQIAGRVQGRTGLYGVKLRMYVRGPGFECSCPSDYEPCKHVGAFLYALQEAVSPVRRPESRPDRPPAARRPRPRPAADAGNSRDSRLTHPAARHQPGTIVGVSVVKAPSSQRFNRFDTAEAPVVRFLRPDLSLTVSTDSPQAGGTRAGGAGAFRPVFRLEGTPDYVEPGVMAYLLKPALVYVRKDGADGRIESYSPTKLRIQGNRTTESLIARALQELDGGVSALRLMSRWRDRSDGGMDARLQLPIELYLPRSDRLARERPALPRRIAAVRVAWEPEMSHDRSLSLTPRLSLFDASGYSEAVDPNSQSIEVDDRGLILPSLQSGSLWYLFDSDLPGQDSDMIGAIGDVLRLSYPLAYHEVTTLRRLCGEQLAALVRVDAPPATLRIVTVVPVPVVDVKQEYRDYSMAELSFRYGDRELPGTATAGLLPARPEELERLELEPEQLPAGTAWFIARNFDAEMEFAEELYAAVDRLAADQTAWDFVISQAPALLERGFEIRITDEAVRRSKAVGRYRVTESGESWFAVEPGLFDGENFVQIDEIICERIVRAAGRVYVLEPGSEIPADFTGRQRIERRDLAAIDEIAARLENLSHPALREYSDLKRRLSSFDSIEPVEVPVAFRGRLRPYQLEGLGWLWFLHGYGLGGILADDMGLGKTVQALALLMAARERGEMQRALVVCPVSTLSNWNDECRRFTPDLLPLVHGGQARNRTGNGIGNADLVLVSYDTFLRDAELFTEIDFDYLILDEAQTIKNPNAKRRRALASIEAPHRLALTGTPVENGAIELWSIMDVLMPGLLGSRSAFSRRYAGNRHGGVDPEALARLQRIIRPLVLRRTKTQVAPELPPREEQIVYAELGSRQAALYESLRRTYESRIARQVQSGELRESSMMILEAMLRLRQAAILPALVDFAHQAIPGAKLDLMVDLLAEIASEGNKVLVFSQFTAVLDEVGRRLESSTMPRFRLDGSTPQSRRAEQIAAFQNHPGAACFLISLKAGGLGINLTAADYVLLLDPWWNPAVEAQAIDRSHRIGRNGTVFAYRLVARGTIEEKMLRLQERKRAVADALIKADQGMLRDLSGDDLLELFSR